LATAIRLARHGRNKKPFYRVVVCDKEKKRDGRFIEMLGTVDPLKEPALVNLKEDRVKYWVGVGAQPSDTVASYIDGVCPGFLEELEKEQKDKIRSKRAKRKAAGKGKARDKSEAKARRKSRKDREKPEPVVKAAEEEEAPVEEATEAATEEAPKEEATEAATEEAPKEEAATEEKSE
jgi:small subunit ribosomal protein S16